jgi:hypothetical protein
MGKVEPLIQKTGLISDQSQDSDLCVRGKKKRRQRKGERWKKENAIHLKAPTILLISSLLLSH